MQKTMSRASVVNCRHMNTRLKSLSVLVSICYVSLFLGGCDSSVSNQNPQPVSTETIPSTSEHLLYSFDNATMNSPILDGASVNTAGSKLNVTFPRDQHMPALSFEVSDELGFAEFKNGNLAFDVVNANGESVHLYVNLMHGDEVLQSHSVSIPDGYEGTVFFPFSGPEASADIGFWGDPPSWSSDELRMIWRSWKKVGTPLKPVEQVRFFVIGNLNTKRLRCLTSGYGKTRLLILSGLATW